MAITRREFLKWGGIVLLGLGAWPTVRGLAANRSTYEANPQAYSGQKWGLAITMSTCWPHYQAGCRKCFLACQREHNIPDIDNPKEEIKWIWTEPYERAFPELNQSYLNPRYKGRPFIVLCNHCDNPPCVRVCPTQATFKRPDGIVAMDYHRCIGCRYCMAACPYGARSFNFQDPRPFIREPNPAFPTREKGVVEKCNLCAERIDQGLVPACVEACPYGAIAFGDLEDPTSNVRKALYAVGYAIQRKPELGTKPKVYYLV